MELGPRGVIEHKGHAYVSEVRGAMAGVVHSPACPPSVVDHCVSARLTGGIDLLLARGTSLELYTLREELQRMKAPGGGGGAAASGQGGGSSRSGVLDGVST